ncbi:MAG: hypothetical protein AABX31_00975 [Nanoarchaeota archaeon]
MNSLDLHWDREIPLPYKLYQDDENLQEKLRRLLSEYRSPIGALHFINRLKEVEAHSAVYEKWSNLCPTLGYLIARAPPYPFGSIKIIRGEKRLWDFIGTSPLQEGVIQISERQHLSLDGFLIPGVAMRNISARPPQKLEEEIFSYLGLEKNQSTGRSVCLPKVRDYPYLTLLAFSSGGKMLGSSRLDDHGCLIGVR